MYCTIFNCLQPLCHIVRELNKNTKCRLHLWGKTSAERKNLYLLVGQGIARSVQLVVTLRPFTAHLQRSIWQNCFDLQRLLLLNSIGCKILRPLFFFLEKLNGKIFSHTHIHQKKLFCSKAWFKRSAKLGLSSFFWIALALPRCFYLYFSYINT